MYWCTMYKNPVHSLGPSLPYVVMLQDFLWEIYGIFFKIQ